jgi:hypothetical protein
VPQPEQPEAKPSAAETARPSAPRAEVVAQGPPPAPPEITQPKPPEMKSLPALIPTTVPVPPKTFEITGSGSNNATGQRAWNYSDVLLTLSRQRMGFTGAGGHSMLDPYVQFREYGDVLRYLPRALANVLFTPFPWQWLDVGGSTGLFKALSVVEALLLYALIVPLIVGLVAVVRRGSPDALYLAVFVVAMALLLGFVISSLGTLFRLRLELLLPLLSVAGLGLARLRHRGRWWA